MKIATNYAYRTYPNQQKRNNTAPPMHSQHKTSTNEVSFNGKILDSIISRFKPPKTSREAINRLSRRDHGCYYKDKNGVIKRITPEEFATTNFDYGSVLIKQPVQYSLMPSGNNVINCKYRMGISPLWILTALKQKIGRITFMVGTDSKSRTFQTLHLPKTDKENKAALDFVKNFERDFKDIDILKDELTPTMRTKYMFDKTQEAVRLLYIKGLVLEDEYKLV